MVIELKYAHLCDYACLGAREKPILVGVFDIIFAPVDASPINLPPCFFFAKITASIADGTNHSLSLVVRNEDEEIVNRLDMKGATFGASGQGRPLGGNLLLQISGMPFPRHGDYTFEVLVDNKKVGETPLYISELPPA